MTQTNVKIQSWNWLWAISNNPRREAHEARGAAREELLERIENGGMACKLCGGGGWLKDWGSDGSDEECTPCEGSGTVYITKV